MLNVGIYKVVETLYVAPFFLFILRYSEEYESIKETQYYFGLVCVVFTMVL